MAILENALQESMNLPYPATTNQVAGMVNGVLTDVMVMNFSDRIMVTISQQGRLAHWLHVPLGNENPGTDGMHTFAAGGENNLLPLSGLTATSLLGGYASGQDTVGQLLACQIATAIATRSPAEKRLLVVGLGLGNTGSDRDSFFSIIDLVLQCI
ncbi:hypothetical protein N7462_010374 [Penicillium macrosclerotiorum]|uniref:uncharacterized protein n=1 Tax=Penicillium macrosclerotiorum TaxID=303699 RepID=UPI002547F1D3|nr:uncharacterized protein N7462_010374 [Penicillium macrosclerotiorum]KAJ5669304.1 hypothetical protein N7462_010374 [Penicillium macrosclerotiorum]